MGKTSNDNLGERFNELVKKYIVVKGQENLLSVELAEYGENSIWSLGWKWKEGKEKRKKAGANEDGEELSESDLKYRRLESDALRLCNKLAAMRLEMAKVVLEPFFVLKPSSEKETKEKTKNYRFDRAGSVAFHPVFNAYGKGQKKKRDEQESSDRKPVLTRSAFLYHQKNAVGDIADDRILVNPSLVADLLLNDDEGRECLRWRSGKATEGGLAEPLAEHISTALNFADYDETKGKPFTWLLSTVILKQKDLYERMGRHREGPGQQQLNIAERDENDSIPQGAITEDIISGNAFDTTTTPGSFGELVGDAKAVFLRHSLDYARLDGLCRDAEIQQKRIVDFFREMVSKKSSIQDVASSLESKKARKKKSGKALSKNIASWRTLYTFDLISVLNVGSDIRRGDLANPREVARDDTSGMKDFYYLEESKHKYRLMCVLFGSFPVRQAGMIGRFTEAYAYAKFMDFRAVVDWNLVGSLLKELSLASSFKEEEIDAKYYQFDSEYMRFDEFFAAGVGGDPDEGLPYCLAGATEEMLSNVPNIRDKLNTYMEKRRALFKELGYKSIVNAHCEEGLIADM